MGQLVTHVVCRSFGDDTIREGDPLRRRLAGEVVNALSWRNVQGLEKNRHVVPAPESLEPVADTYGRLWVDLEMLHKAEREALNPRVGVQVDPVIAETPGSVTVGATEEIIISGSDHYPEPVRVGNPAGQHTKYELWDGSTVIGKAAALEAHSAGVQADLERRRLESSTESSADDDEMNSAGPEDET